MILAWYQTWESTGTLPPCFITSMDSCFLCPLGSCNVHSIVYTQLTASASSRRARSASSVAILLFVCILCIHNIYIRGRTTSYDHVRRRATSYVPGQLTSYAVWTPLYSGSSSTHCARIHLSTAAQLRRRFLTVLWSVETTNRVRT